MPLLSFMWSDHILNDASWLRADTFSWHTGSSTTGVYRAAYAHLADDYDSIITQSVIRCDVGGGVYYYRYPSLDSNGASHPYAFVNYFSSSITILYADTETPGNFYDSPNGSTVVTFSIYTGTSSQKVPTVENIAGTIIAYYTAADGHKIVLADQESNVAAIYAATGVAWYYIIDTTNQRFKLPRENPDKRLLKEISASPVVFEDTNNQVRLAYGRRSETFDLYLGIGSVPGGYNALWYRSGQHDPTQGTYDSAPAPAFHTIKTNISYNTFYQGEKYLYFYVGNFTQTALENTAGLNTELFNDKLDITTFDTDGVKYCSFNTDTRVQITTSNQTAAKNGWLVGFITISGNNLYLSVFVNDNEIVHSPWVTTAAWGACSICMPIKAGQTYRYDGNATVQSNKMYFYPND